MLKARLYICLLHLGENIKIIGLIFKKKKKHTSGALHKSTLQNKTEYKTTAEIFCLYNIWSVILFFFFVAKSVKTTWKPIEQYFPMESKKIRKKKKLC